MFLPFFHHRLSSDGQADQSTGGTPLMYNQPHAALPLPARWKLLRLLVAVLFLVPDLDLRRRATAERLAMRHAVCAYLELVALERAGDAGTVEALERAATVADAAPFARIRDALTRAQLGGQPPWIGLADLARRRR